MKRIGKYIYADKGMKFTLTKKGLDIPQVRHTFIEYPNGVGKVPAPWVDSEYVHEVVNDY